MLSVPLNRDEHEGGQAISESIYADVETQQLDGGDGDDDGAPPLLREAFPLLRRVIYVSMLSRGARVARCCLLAAAVPALGFYGGMCMLHRPIYGGGAAFALGALLLTYLLWSWQRITIARASSIMPPTTSQAQAARRKRAVSVTANEASHYDFFISYRVDADKEIAKDLYTDLKLRGHQAFLDSVCLKFGEDWRVGFLNGCALRTLTVPTAAALSACRAAAGARPLSCGRDLCVRHVLCASCT